MLNTPLDIAFLVNSEIKKAIKNFKVHKYYKSDQEDNIGEKLATPEVFLGSLPANYLSLNTSKSNYPYILIEITKTEIININNKLVKKIKFRIFAGIEFEKKPKNFLSKDLKNVNNLNDINISDLGYIDILNLIELLEQNLLSGFNKKINVDEKSINSFIYLNNENVWESETDFSCFIQVTTFSKFD